MESFSKEFERSILNLLQKISSENFLVVATVPSKNLSLSDKLKTHHLSKLFTVITCLNFILELKLIYFKVSFQNRNKIIDEVYDLVIEAFNKL